MRIEIQIPYRTFDLQLFYKKQVYYFVPMKKMDVFWVDNIITHICRSCYNGANHPHTQTWKKKFVRPIYLVRRDKTQSLYDVNGRYILGSVVYFFTYLHKLFLWILFDCYLIRFLLVNANDNIHKRMI